MTAAAQRSKAEVDALYRRAVDTLRVTDNMINLWPTAHEPYGLWDASMELELAIMTYHRPITNERTFNALRDAIRHAEAEIDKYKRQVRG